MCNAYDAVALVRYRSSLSSELPRCVCVCRYTQGFLTIDGTDARGAAFVFQFSDSVQTVKRLCAVVSISLRCPGATDGKAVKYQDDDGDWVSLVTDADVEEMVRFGRTLPTGKRVKVLRQLRARRAATPRPRHRRVCRVLRSRVAGCPTHAASSAPLCDVGERAHTYCNVAHVCPYLLWMAGGVGFVR